ncbi:hypothetical protein D3C73_616480 [compost metagenome]
MSSLQIRPPSLQRLTLSSCNLHTDRESSIRLVRFKGLTKTLIQMRIIRFPDTISYMQSSQINVIASRNNLNKAALCFALELLPFASQIVDTAAFFFFRGIPSIKYDAVTTLQRSFQLAYHAITQNLDNAANKHAAAFRISPINQLLVIRTIQETVRKAAGEALLQFAQVFLRRPRINTVKISVNGLAVFAHYVRYILRCLQSPFNLEGAHSRFD